MSLGAVVTTANPLNTASEISRQVADCNPKLAFATPEERVGSTLGVRVVGSLSEMTKKKPSEIRVRNRVNQDGTAMLLYSSGTTGRSKGVIISHGNLIAHVARYIAEPLEPNQTFLCTVPLFHTFGLLNYALATVALGSKVVILRKFDLHGMMAAVEKYRATTLVLVPPILVAMINGSDLIKAKYDLTSLKTITEFFLEKYPTVDIFQGYALTESNSSGASTDSVEESKRHGAVGLLSSGVEARIVDPDTGRIMGVNQTGELWLKGPAITKEATKETINSEGWLITGDLCCIDDEGFVFILDRLKELIKYKAYQVPPAELEGLLLTHPEIIDAAVIPFPDREVGRAASDGVRCKKNRKLVIREVIDGVCSQTSGTIQESTKGGFRVFHTKKSIREDSAQGPHQARNFQLHGLKL
ncbi:hypothetical protein Bca52824_076505 [Brassica carinata]|uniref:AMP-dependent synthetase/ligase domain-containing protein n=1 Tax=Brassica carinata TaxID=52824 RepID=A0A8X7TZ53_BRACI|nr:hypothetical protein Bca52824_076505 [Brassica carinata]